MFKEMASIGSRMGVMENDAYSTSVSPKSELVTGSNYDSVIRLSRLAMLIECEGCITIGMTPPTKTRNRPALTPAVSLTNTARMIVDEAKGTLTIEGIGFTSRPARPSAGLGKKPRFDVDIHGHVRVQAVLEAMLPYLRSKKGQAALVLEFLKLRQAASPKAAYSDREWEITTAVRKLNGTQPHRKALAKAIAYLDLPSSDSRSRTAEYYRKYVDMCIELQGALEQYEHQV